MRFVVKKWAFSYPCAYIFSDKARYENYHRYFEGDLSNDPVARGVSARYIGADCWEGLIRLDLLDNIQDIVFTYDILASEKNAGVMGGYDVIAETVINVKNNKIQLLGDVEDPSVVCGIENGIYAVRVSTPLEEGRKGYNVDDYCYKIQIEIWPHK